jgi:hypothetical protein
MHSPIEGREPAFEAGEAGSTPARGAIHIAVAVVYWRACLAVNEEVRVRSPPVTPIRHPRALTNGRQPVPKTGVVVMSPRGSIPPLSSRFLVALSANGQATWFSPRKRRVRFPPASRTTASARRLRRPGFHPGDAGSNPAAVARPTAIGSRPALRTQALEVRILSWVRRRAGVVTGRSAKPWPTTVARVRFAPSPPRSTFAPLDRNR